jgi:hypothetical protein
MVTNTEPIDIPVNNDQHTLYHQSCPPNFILLHNKKPPLYPNVPSLSPQQSSYIKSSWNHKAKSNISLSLSPTTSYISQIQYQLTRVMHPGDLNTNIHHAYSDNIDDNDNNDIEYEHVEYTVLDEYDIFNIFDINHEQMKPCWLRLGKEMHITGLL